MYLGNSRAVNTRFCIFTFKHSWVITKFDVVMSNVHSSKCNFVTSKLSYFCPWSSVFETFAGNVPFRAIIGTGKKNFSKHFLQNFRVTKCFYAVRTIKHGFLIHLHLLEGERGGSVVKCRTPEREVRGSRPTVVVLCPWARHFTPRKYWLITQEAMAPSRHDWKIVDWDVKPQHNQPTSAGPLGRCWNPRLFQARVSTAPEGPSRC